MSRGSIYSRIQYFYKGSLTCGVVSARTSSRIIGGLEVSPPHRLPWMVKLGSAHNDSCGKCGGTLISDRHIITAGHCLDDWVGNKV